MTLFIYSRRFVLRHRWFICLWVLLPQASWSPQAVLVIPLACVSLILLGSCLTLSLFFKIWSLNSHSLFMSNHCIKKSVSFIVYYYKLASNLALATKTMWSCKKCVLCSFSCCVSLKFFKCSECMLHTSHKCDLVISKVKWTQV